LHSVSRAIYKRLGLLHLGRRRVRDLIDFIRDREIDTVIDVGANVGQFGDSLREGGFKGKIVSFEPIEAVFQVLKSKAATDGNWEAHHCALGAAPGEAAIHVSELSVCSSILELNSNATLHDTRIAVERAETVTVRTLDEVAARITGRTLLKIDTQGYEKQVLEGARDVIPRVLGILMELPVIHVYEGEWQFHEAVRFMSGLGFVLAQIQPVGYHGVDKVSAVEFDCLFRPRNAVDAPASEQSA
jgi:FkbM family methyltransferase